MAQDIHHIAKGMDILVVVIIAYVCLWAYSRGR